MQHQGWRAIQVLTPTKTTPWPPQPPGSAAAAPPQATKAEPLREGSWPSQVLVPFSREQSFLALSSSGSLLKRTVLSGPLKFWFPSQENSPFWPSQVLVPFSREQSFLALKFWFSSKRTIFLALFLYASEGQFKYQEGSWTSQV